MTPRHCAQAGFSLIELMIAISIGMVLLMGLATLFSNTSTSQREVQRAAQQIENGRFAMDVMTQDLQLSGFFGAYRKSAPPGAIPDPCLVTVADLTTAVGLPVQGYTPTSLTTTPTLPATCNTWIGAANLNPGSDVLIIRRAETEPVAAGTVTTSGGRYIQTNPVTIDVQAGGGTTSCTSKASGAAALITRRCTIPTANDACPTECGAGTSPAGYVRKLNLHIYFVSPCNVPSSGSTCDSAADGGRPIPTLKRLELIDNAGTADFQVVPIAEGVEYLKLSWGIDDTPTTVNSDTGLIGDGAPDRYSLAPSLTDFTNVVSVRVDLLVRNPEPSVGYSDTKTYNLGSDPTTPTTAAYTITPSSSQAKYRRHVYSSEVRMVNLSSRKENP
jgi:type IV pilus assembly protein PilW